MRDWFAAKVICVAAAALAVAILVGYMALCIWVEGNDQLLSGTVLVDSQGETAADLGKLTREEALDVVSGAMRREMGGHGLTLICGEDKQVELSGSLITSSAESAVDLGFATKNSKPNWKLGMLWLGVLHEPIELPLFSSILTPQGEAQAKKLIKSMAEELYVAPVDFTLDENGTLVPAAVGLSVNAEQTQAILDAAAPGESCTIPLEFTPPAPAEDESMFYQDLLAQFTSRLNMASAPAAETVHGRVLQPGELFSYLAVVGEPGEDAGQTASALYDCAVYSNLSIVERTGGISAPDYTLVGLDAAVITPSQDLKFRNTTGFPLKIAASVNNGQLTVQFYGSNPDGIKVEIRQETLSAASWTTIYQPDAGIPRGTIQESTAPADGCMVEVYRCVYDANGGLMSRTLENTSTYEARDQVILYNPADSGPWGAGTTTQPATQPTTRPTVRPTTRPTQSSRPTSRPVTPTPTPTLTPAPTPTRPVTPSPAPTPTPTPTPIPTPTPTERLPEASMPAWMQSDAPASSTPAPTPSPVPTEPLPQASLPAWLS